MHYIAKIKLWIMMDRVNILRVKNYQDHALKLVLFLDGVEEDRKNIMILEVGNLRKNEINMQ